jgi:hypothetical protein
MISCFITSVSEEPAAFVLYPKDGGSTSLQNIGGHV